MPLETWDDWYLQTSDGVRLYVREVGDGPLGAIVLHGGWGAEHSYLIDAFEGIAGSRFVFYDQRGSLRSPCAPDLISVEKHIADLERLRVQLGVERPVLIGHSMGTSLAMSYAATHPGNVGGLVLLGSVTPRMPLPEGLVETGPTAQDLMSRPEVAAEWHRLGLDRDDLSDKEATLKWRIQFASVNLYNVARWRSLKGGQVFYNATAGDAASDSMPKSWNFLPALEAIARPITVIQGDHDYATSANALTQLFGTIPNAEVLVVRDAGHEAWIDEPDQFRNALERGLSKALASQA